MTMKKVITKTLLVILSISISDCAAPYKQDKNTQKPEMTMTEKVLDSSVLRNSNAQPTKNMRIEEYAKYRSLNSAQRQNREVLVDNFIRGLGVDGF